MFKPVEVGCVWTVVELQTECMMEGEVVLVVEELADMLFKGQGFCYWQ